MSLIVSVKGEGKERKECFSKFLHKLDCVGCICYIMHGQTILWCHVCTKLESPELALRGFFFWLVVMVVAV